MVVSRLFPEVCFSFSSRGALDREVVSSFAEQQERLPFRRPSRDFLFGEHLQQGQKHIQPMAVDESFVSGAGPGAHPSSGGHHDYRVASSMLKRRRSSFLASRPTVFLLYAKKESKNLLPELDQTGTWNDNYRPFDPTFAINHPWNQNRGGGPFAGELIADASHPFGGPVNASNQQVVWNSVQPRNTYGTDTTNYLLEAGRHWYAGGDPRTPDLIYDEIPKRNPNRLAAYNDALRQFA